MLTCIYIFFWFSFSYTKPQSFEDCVGDELPVGWEEAYDSNIGRYYINHIAQSTQLEDPRQEWKSVQEQMLSDYLSAAQDQLENKREMYDVKQQRLQLAQEEYNHLNKLAASRSSCEYLPKIKQENK